MKKRGVKFLGGVALLGALCLAYGFLKQQPEKGEETGGERLLSLEEGGITSLAVSGKEESFTFAKGEGGWVLEGKEDFPLDETKLLNGLTALEEAKTKRTLEGVKDFSQYGLETPQWELSYVSGEQSGTLALGSENASTGQYYVRRNREDRICLVDTASFTGVVGDLYDFAAGEEFPVISTAEIREVSVSDGEKTYSYQKDGVEGSGNSWSFSREGKRETADEGAVSELNTAVSSLAYGDFLEYDCGDWESYGLEKPQKRISIQYEAETEIEESETLEESGEGQGDAQASADSTDAVDSVDEPETVTESLGITLLVGNQDEEGNYYVTTEGSTEVHTMSSDSLEAFFQYSEEELLDKRVSYLALDQLSTLEADAEGTAYTLEMKEEVQEEAAEADDETAEEKAQEETKPALVMKYYVNGAEVESSEFTSFYSALISMKGQSRDDTLPVPKGEPQLRFSFQSKDGDRMEAAYYAYDENFYLGVNGEKKFLVNKMEVKHLQEKLTELAAAE